LPTNPPYVAPCAVYHILSFIRDRCRAYSGHIDRLVIDGLVRLPSDMILESDAQEYTLNWPSRLDRRNAKLSCYCTVDNDSRFILGMHANFDAGINPFVINQDAARNGDMDLHEPFRRHARYWLVGDEFKAGGNLAEQYPDERKELARQVIALYAAASC